MKHSLLVRMTAPLVAVSILLLLLGTVTAWYVHRLQRNAADTISVNVASIRAAEELEIGVREIRTHINQFLLTGDRQHLAAVPVQRQQTERWLKEAVRLATTRREQELMASVQQGYERFLAEFDRLAASEVAASSRTELRELVGDVLTDDILKPAQEYLDLNEQIIADSSRAGQALARRMVFGLLLLGTCGPIAGLLAGFVISYRVSRTLVELSVPVRDAAGRLSEVVGPFVTTKETGIGLGLAICQRIAEAHGGEVRAADRSPQGAVFTVRLPVSHRPAAASLAGDFEPAPADGPR